MPASQSLSVDGHPIVVREIPIAAVRDWYQAVMRGRHEDAVGGLAIDDLPLMDLALMTDLSAAELERFTPSQLTQIVAKARELNPHFFALHDCLQQVLADAAPLIEAFIARGLSHGQ